MNGDGIQPRCWACCNELQAKDQKVCAICHRWQTWPWKYLTLSNAALAVIAALISTGLTVFTLAENHKRQSHFDFFVHGRSILSQSGNLGLRVQNYAASSVVLDRIGTCVNRTDPSKAYEIVLADRFRLFPPTMITDINDRFFVPAQATDLTWTVGEEYDCNVDARNGNGYMTTLTFSAKVA